MNTYTQQTQLNAPLVPAADPKDGLLKVSDLEGPINVDIRIWDAMRPGYFLQLMLNDQLVGETWTMGDADQPGDVVRVVLNPDHMSEQNRYQLRYRVTNNENGTSSDSDPTQLIVDFTPPGSALLAPFMLAIVSVGRTLRGRIPGYYGMDPGDVIQTLCNETSGPTYCVRPENLTTSPITISFSKEFIDSLLTDRVSFSYYVTDRAGNRSTLAEAVELTIQS